jgi:hypothetical protein
MIRHYLKSQLWVLLCGGAVGPIYLIVYYEFMSPPDRQYVGWLLWAGWLIAAADVLIALALANYRAKSTAKTAALEQHGELALARITGMKGTGTEINDQPLVKLALQISGRGFAFDTQKKVIASVTRMGNLNARKLVVLVDTATHDYQIDWERSDLVNGLVPAQFTLSDENRTYDLTGQAGPLMEILQLLKDNGIPLSSPLDLRSADPALRRQFQDVVRRAAAVQPSPAFAAGPGIVAGRPGFAPPRPSAAQRLQELAGLHANEAITDEEYAERRRQIISEI